MSDITVELDDATYTALLTAANESGMSVSDFANSMLRNYLEENYGEV